MTTVKESLSPWEILGLKEGASDREIKKAFRKLAKEHHPDKGGNGEIFAEISKAFALIENKEARKRFERDEGRPEKSLTAMAIEVVLLKFMSGVQNSKDIQNLKYAKILDVIQKAFHDDLTQMKRDHRRKRLQIDIMTDLISRFIYEGEDGNDFICYALEDEVRSTRRNLKSVERQMQVAVRGLTLLKRYKFKSETLQRTCTPTATTFYYGGY